VEVFGEAQRWSVEDSLHELAQLAHTAHLDVEGEIIQRVGSPNGAHYIGSGKLRELKSLVRDMECDVVIFGAELLPRQQRNLEEALSVRIIDRTALILDIFAQHARTQEGRIQVELAQYEYLLPRLTRRWSHLSRQAVGGVGLRGPGEMQLETDRRMVRRRIRDLKAQLGGVRRHRELYRDRRRRRGIPIAAIVGYTNAGKSTLLNSITGAGVRAENALFATLDPVTRRMRLPRGAEVLLSDTVGFVNKLPPTLVDAFRATLEEIEEANLLLHVVDITHQNVLEQTQAVEEILRAMKLDRKPMIVAFNKIDLLPNESDVERISSEYPNSVAVSALTGYGLDRLMLLIEHTLRRELVDLRVKLPYDVGRLKALFHQKGLVEREEYSDQGVIIEGSIPADILHVFEDYVA